MPVRESTYGAGEGWEGRTGRGADPTGVEERRGRRPAPRAPACADRPPTRRPGAARRPAVRLPEGYGRLRGGREAPAASRPPRRAGYATYSSATDSAESSTARPSFSSASVTVHGGTTWVRFMFTKGHTPPSFTAAANAAIGAFASPAAL